MESVLRQNPDPDMISQEERFLRTLFPARLSVGGWLLIPRLTIGHLMLLRRLRNPFGQIAPLDELEATRADVGEALTVLSMGWRKAWELFQGGRPWRLRWALWRRTSGGVVQSAARAVALHEFILSAFDRPNTISRRDGRQKEPARVQAPYWLVMIHRLVDAGHAPDEILDMSVASVLWMAAAADEDRGAVLWCSEQEEQVQQMVRDEILKAQRGAGN